MSESNRFGVVGLGYVGLPLALSFARSGYDVTGVDIDDERVASLQNGISYVDNVSDEELTNATDTFHPTTAYENLSETVAVAICVPTPLDKTDQPNLTYVQKAVERLASVVQEGCTLILESTVYPGATRELVASTLTENGRTIGEDTFVAYSPERINPGDNRYEITEIPKVVGGVTENCGDRAEALYLPVFDEVVRVESATVAELVKILENTFRTVNIGLVNELAMLADILGIDIWETIEAASTKPFGYMPFYPGPGLGGHCIPIDPLYLSWKAEQHGTDIKFIQLANRINRGMPQHVTERIIDLLGDRSIPVFESDVLVLGVSYKRDTSDTRESPAFDVISFLEDRGATVSYHDPHVPTITIEGKEYETQELTAEALQSKDCVVLLTDHSAFEYEFIAEHSNQIFDTRNAFNDLKQDNVHTL